MTLKKSFSLFLFIVLLVGCAGSPHRLGTKTQRELKNNSDDEIYRAAGNQFSQTEALTNEAIERLDNQSDERILNIVQNVNSENWGVTEYPEKLRNEAMDLAVERDIFSTKEIKLIKEEKISIGMSEEALRASWGPPEDVNETVTSYSVRKQYVYGLGQYVYVVDGEVTSWQN